MNLKKVPLLAATRLARCLPEAAQHRFWRTFAALQSLPLRHLRGETTAGDTATLLAVGKSPEIDWLPQRFFVAEPACRALRSQSLLNLRARLLAESRSADLVVAHVDREIARRIAGTDFLRIPHRIGTRFTVPAVTRGLVSRRNSLSDDFRLVRNRGFTARTVHDDAALRVFYDSLYRPTVASRHRDLGILKSFVSVCRAAQTGGLLQIMQAGEIVGGVVFSRKVDQLLNFAMGQRTADHGRPRSGVDAACYYHLVETARGLGCREIDFGGCRPSLDDGILRYKRKWGMRLVENRGTHHDLLVRWNSVTPAIEAFLQKTSLIFRQGDGFAALGAGPATDWTSRAMPGIVSYHGLRPGAPFGAPDQFFSAAPSALP